MKLSKDVYRYRPAVAIEPLENRAMLSANLLVNGDFSRGDVGFSTKYANGHTSLVNEGVFVVGTDPHLYHPAGADFGDHTTGSGKMLVINGAIVPNVIVWRESVPVVPGVVYNFSGWAASWATSGSGGGDISPAEPQIIVNGKVIESTQLPSADGQWTSITGTWTATSNRATITLIDRNIDLGGNDSAYDDFSFTPLASIHGAVVANTSVDRKINRRVKPVRGVTVFLDTNGDGIYEAGEPTATTNKNGGYSFTGLVAGNYSVCQIPPAGSELLVGDILVQLPAGKQVSHQNLLDTRIIPDVVISAIK